MTWAPVDIFLLPFFYNHAFTIFFLIEKRVLHCANDQNMLFTSGMSFDSLSIKIYSFFRECIGNRIKPSKIKS